MPPTDESPRSGIANLINRFENQTKRTSGAVSISSRSSSVVSHTSSVGDTLKEETKEKREWPPRSSIDKSSSGFVMPSYLRPNVGTLASTVASSLAATSSPPAGPPGPDSTVTATLALQKDTVQTPSDTPKPATTPNGAATPVTAPPIPLEPSKSTSSIKSDSSLKARTAIAPVDTNPLLPSTTAQEGESADEVEPATPKPGALQRKPSTLTVTATAGAKPSGKTPSTARPPASARTSGIPATPKTPARTTTISKAPTAASAGTPRSSLAPATTPAQPLKPQHTGGSVASSTGGGSSTRKPVSKPTPATPSRAKTPLKPSTLTSRARSPIVRSKTPSTGLYAPTAASLARSRNAPPLPTPTPVRKVLSSEVAERLSKPTAASLSKVRSPPPAALSSRQSMGGGTPVKKAGTPVKTTPIRKSVSSPAIKKASPTLRRTGGLVESQDDIAVLVNGGPVLEDSTSIPEAISIASIPSEPEVTVLPTVVEPEAPKEEPKVEEEPVVVVTQEHKPTNGVKVGNEIEDLVNLLEFVPASKMFSSNGSPVRDEDGIVRLGEVTGEIPDEE